MQLPRSSEGFNGGGGPTAASLDRIDSTKGYIAGNVEFVCRFVNLGKSDLSREEVMKFIAAVRGKMSE
jgi:hypothetical protein